MSRAATCAIESAQRHRRNTIANAIKFLHTRTPALFTRRYLPNNRGCRWKCGTDGDKMDAVNYQLVLASDNLFRCGTECNNWNVSGHLIAVPGILDRERVSSCVSPTKRCCRNYKTCIPSSRVTREIRLGEEDGKDGEGERKKKKQQGKKLFIQPRVYSTLCSARRTRTMARVNVSSMEARE